VRIVHFSDPHAGGGAEDWMAYFDKRWVGVFNYRFRRRFRHDLSKLEKAVDYIMSTRPDVAVCTGDLTSAGQPGEFEKVRKVLDVLRNSDIPLIYMPGNHDCYVKRPKCVRAMKDMVEYLSRGRYTFDALPVKMELGGVEFLLVNTSRPSNLLCSWGFLYKEDSQKISDWCGEEKRLPRILVSHYPMTEDHPILRVRHRLFGQKKVVQLLQENQIDLALCGHVHKPYFQYRSNGSVLECCAGSVTRNGSLVEITGSVENGFEFKTIEL
jgi:3',5'-cyclic AMP phosphodiesterase CpdA